MASNRLGQTLGLWFVDTTRFISIVVKIDRQTDGRAMISQAHTAPTTFRIRSRGFFLHGESKFIVYGIQSSDVGLSKVGEEKKKKCVCVCVRCQRQSAGRYVASSAHVTFLLCAELADNSCEATDARSRFGFMFSTGTHLVS